MTIPIIIEIALSLIFIYLILSLLASEIQELIATLLQWRAVHLKESIETLLAGNNKKQDLKSVKTLANELYKSPLIKTLNQEAKGFLATIPRQINHLLGFIVRFGRKSMFGYKKHSGPSYIPSHFFAASLLESLKLPELHHQITALNLQWFVQENVIVRIASILHDQSQLINRITLDFNSESELIGYLKIFTPKNDSSKRTLLILNDFYKLKHNLNKIILNFESNKADLAITINRIADNLERYFEFSQTYLPKMQVAQLDRLNGEIFGRNQNERLYVLQDLQLTIFELVEIIESCGEITQRWQTYKNDKQLTDREAPIAATKEATQKTKQYLEELKQDVDQFKPELMATEVQDICNDIEAILQRSHSAYDYKSIINFILNLDESRHLIKEKIINTINTIIASYEERFNNEYEEVYNQFKQDIQLENTVQLPVAAKEFILTLGCIANLPNTKLIDDLEKLLNHVLELNLPKSITENLSILAERTQSNLQDVREDFHQFEQEVATWFDRSMERASGVYKRNAKLVAIAIGCTVAVAANADTLYMVSRLTKDSALRTVVTQTANDIAASDTQLTPETLDKIDRAVDNLSLPIGWSEFNRRHQRQNRQIPWDVRYLVGWFLSGLAISMGASFWYDMLGKVMDVSNVGKKPKPSRIPPQDRG
ncbi:MULTISPECIES: hypothetical protein [unclassified Coleofasciculus]|uniref:hypothetical protein n=1 Tax=unclassified Coleofasciculus TaxID=2692782 RepID=UPI0018810B04|nr:MULTISPECIES: hypothetical protein [unclassified Coleofasciculus]MBE9124605.1 hypothetical protein [Coleofasciculus sp. LEGE 07081]MBE9147569.1 hypothetical protein [Coleofasciculus sp. LEGE 07092]